MVFKRFNVKVDFFLFLSTIHLRCMGNGIKAAHTFLTSALGGGEWLVSCSNHFTCKERATDSYLMGDGGGGKIGCTAKRNSSFPYRELNSVTKCLNWQRM
jgi:hypothetical protein